jgi:phage shock protein PspC (stress-responsive transcriptional regulator)
MILLIISIVGFWQRAKILNLNPWLWTVIALLSYLGSQFIAGVIIGLSNPELLDKEGLIMIIGIVVSIIALIIAWLIMERQGKIKKEVKSKSNADILDDNFFAKD